MRKLMLTAAMAAAALTTPAGATMVDSGRFTDEVYGFGYGCGFPVEVTGVASGNYHLRDGGDGTFFSLERVTYREIHTNTETGAWFVVRGRFANNETNADHVSGSLFAFDVVKAGQIAVIEDADGNVVYRDRGALRRTILFDTGGDAEAGGEFVDLLDLQLSGPHPSFGRLCEVAEELTTDA